MRALSSWPRPLLLGLAALSAAVTIFYSALWMYGVRFKPGAYLGVDVDTAGEAATLDLRGVVDGSPAHRAGLRAGDRILTLNGRPLTPWAPLLQPVGHGRPGGAPRRRSSRTVITSGRPVKATVAIAAPAYIGRRNSNSPFARE